VREALNAGRTIEKAWVQKPATGGYDRALYELIAEIRKRGGVINEVDQATMNKLSRTFGHQGIIVQTAVHTYWELDALLERAAEQGEPPFFLLLDQIQDAYNLGSILRIADACGAHGVIFPKRRAVGLNALVAKASAGAVEHVPCCRVNNLTLAIEQLKQAGLWIAGADASGRDLYSQKDLTGPLAVVIGSEGTGMSRSVMKHCDFLISIPMCGRVNSLNAAVAGGIIAFEVLRQRKSGLKCDEE
jgi:23S rRNA (guanosine2251-2'-O)-methyltransferase